MAAPVRLMSVMKNSNKIPISHVSSIMLTRCCGGLIGKSSSISDALNRSQEPMPIRGIWHIKRQNYSQFRYHSSSNIPTDGRLEDRQCWKCDRFNGSKEERFFCKCGIIQKIPSDMTYFDVFDLAPEFNLDLEKLSEMYKQYQFKLHPDRYSGKSETEQVLSAALSALVNEAYSILQKPLLRGLYLLELLGDPLQEGTQKLDPDFLMNIMEINEELADTESAQVAEAIWLENSLHFSKLIQQVSEAFKDNDVEKAKFLITRLKYYSNIDDKLKDFQQKYGVQFE